MRLRYVRADLSSKSTQKSSTIRSVSDLLGACAASLVLICQLSRHYLSRMLLGLQHLLLMLFTAMAVSPKVASRHLEMSWQHTVEGIYWSCLS